MSIGGIFRFLSPIRKPEEAGELLRAAWRSTKAATNQPDPLVLDGREPSRLLSELRRTVILGLACAGVSGAGSAILIIAGGDALQIAAGLTFTGMFVVMGFSAFRRARRIAAWLERE
jgi:hypothetical protein